MPPDDAPAAVERLARDASTIVTPPLPITCAVPASTRSAVSSSIPIPRQSGRRLTAPRSRVIDRAFEHAQLGGTQCAGLAGGSDRLPRSRGAVRARAREKMGPGGERGERGKPAGGGGGGGKQAMPHLLPERGAPFGLDRSPLKPVSRGRRARSMRAPVLHSGGPDRRHNDEIRQRDQLPYRIRQ